jgi:hypothetical protein
MWILFLGGDIFRFFTLIVVIGGTTWYDFKLHLVQTILWNDTHINQQPNLCVPNLFIKTMMLKLPYL